MKGQAMSLSTVEQRALELSGSCFRYSPAEKMRLLTISSFPELGKTVALRFLEWCQHNPEGVVSLPTGKTPEHFIKWVSHLLNTWSSADTANLAAEYGLRPERPRIDGLHFVQIDEFYPMSAAQKNSFTWYVNEFYLKNFGFDPKRAMLIDCEKIGLRPGESLADYWPKMEVDLSLRHRQPANELERRQAGLIARIDQWCDQFEQRIRSLGGLGFFLGGIGPDGHIGFNMRGSAHYSTTRLCETNYETQAAAAADLGGVEVSSRRLVITIGLETITNNPKCVSIIMAAGESKAPVVRDAIEREADVLYPATALHKLPGACFYLTAGSTKLLQRRRLAALEAREEIGAEQTEQALVDLAVAAGKRLSELAPSDLARDGLARRTVELSGRRLEELAAETRAALISRIEKGMAPLESLSFLHTEPHHDDIMLGYMPALVRSIRPASNTHHFATLTSGFTAVTNDFLIRQLACLEEYINTANDFHARMGEGDYFNPGNRTARNRDVWAYLDGIASNDISLQHEGTCRRLIRNLMEVFADADIPAVRRQITKLQQYLASAYPGQKDPVHVQKLKGMCREWESECLWGYFGWKTENIHHLRLGFYSGDIFTEEPEENRDAVPVRQLCQRVNPDVLTLAFDPEGSGPDTHYKVMQAIRQALEDYTPARSKDGLRVWGYRNVWYRFHPAEANIYVPVSLNMFSVMQSSFMNTFVSQKQASFPSYEHDGPFCELAQKIQVEQYQTLKTCLGREWFNEHDSALIRATRGFVFLREMTLEELSTHCRRLKAAQE